MKNETSPQDLVISFHSFLSDWFGAKIANDISVLRAQLSRFDPNFSCVTPTSRKISLDNMAKFLPTAYGNDAGVEVGVSDIQEIFSSNDFCMLSYVEHQSSPKTSNRRVASAVFRKDQNLGWLWFHLHETWVQDS